MKNTEIAQDGALSKAVLSNEEKRNIGSVVALYPTPAVVVGTIVDEKVNWMLAAHVGIMGHDKVMVSLRKNHYTNKGIRERGSFTLNIVDEKMLPKADYAGIVSGEKSNKSDLFVYSLADNGMPMVDESPVAMVCVVEDNYETETFDNFICSIAATYAKESVLNENDKIDYEVLKPVLFEMPTYSYLKTGEVIGKCRTFGKEIQQ